MQPVLERAAAQGYAPNHLVCSGETLQGRPSPLMIYKACVDLGVWPLSRVVKVDDSEAGVAEGRAAGCVTVGVAASGNGVGLSAPALAALPAPERVARIAAAGKTLYSARRRPRSRQCRQPSARPRTARELTRVPSARITT
jgi:phosphonoacetaldehyde hydrolase